MSVDMSQFFGVFFEESQEHLDEMEHLLMGISLDEPDPEELNSIFRAAHSIKGGSGVFGFDALTGLTHVMESILDLARNNELVITKPIVNQLLITVDTLKNILECYQSKNDIDWAAIEKGTVELEGLLKNGSPTDLKTASDEENGFGFFDLPVQHDDDGFGFFEPLEDQVVVEDDDSFGFFEELPVAEVQVPKTDASTTKSVVSAGIKPPTNKSTRKIEPTESSSIRVDTGKIDSLVNLVGELVITQSRIKIVGRDVHGEVEEKLAGALDELARNIREIQEAVMSMRMLPMSFAFNRFPRVVRDLADKLGKDLELVIEGGATEIDKGLIEKLVDPLTHLIRNSVDHGIEMPDVRVAAGKSITGTILLNAEQRGSSIIITITDDGAGLNRQRILEKAKLNGMDIAKDMPDSKVWPLIFEAGFSTAEAVTDVSGRGVGMDVVRRNIESIGGTVEIESTADVGSTFIIRLPLTLAIVDGMCVSVSDQTFIIPLINIMESMQPTKEQIKSIGNDRLLWVREEYWPLVPLHELMDIEGANPDPTKAIVVLVETARKRFAILVDALEGQQQVVIKSLEQHYKRVPGVAGATIMGDGGVALILDIESIAAIVTIPNQSEVPVDR